MKIAITVEGTSWWFYDSVLVFMFSSQYPENHSNVSLCLNFEITEDIIISYSVQMDIRAHKSELSLGPILTFFLPPGLTKVGGKPSCYILYVWQ